MSKNVVTLDMDTMTTVIGVKMVGKDCPLSQCCLVVPDYNPDLLGCTYDSEAGTFTDADSNVIYTL